MLALLTFAVAVTGVLCDMPEPYPRIVKGENATEGEFPHMVSLRRIATNRHFCGGSIITKNWVMTAAHCCVVALTRPAYTISLANVGSIYLDRGGTNHTIEEIYPHEKFKEGYFNINDICLIRVKEPFAFDDNVQQITLAGKNFKVNSGDKVTLSGWGAVASWVIPNRLQKLTTYSALTNKECEEETWKAMPEEFICARADILGQGVCYGDSGSALLKGKVQVGVTSFMYSPCGNPTPDVYARVSVYENWIREKLGADAADLKFSE